jgi:hypothetical protein
MVKPRELVAVSGETIRVPDPDRVVHLQFRRFAGCPLCNLHLRSIVLRHKEIEAAGIREVVLFHSSAEELREHVADLPFAVVADPDQVLYKEFGVVSSPKALLNPRVWPTIVRAIARDLPPVLRRRKPFPKTRPDGGRLVLPADFLIAGDGAIVASKHGIHAYDQWSVDELLSLKASTLRRGERTKR